MDLQLQGKRALVTGGTRGIGLAIVQALVAEGCRVGVIARGEEGLARVRAALPVHVAAGDVTDTASHDAAVAQLLAQLGGLDVAVANAGGSAAGRSDEAPDELWRAQLELNHLSAMRLLRATAPALEGHGSLTIISSISGFEAFGHPAYVAAKAAVHAYAKVAAKEVGPRGIRVNCVAPGSILFPGGSWERRIRADPGRWNAYVASLPFARLGTPEEVARAVLFVASPAASWISGAILPVDGAQSVAI
jgi:3-oxoacyl-[acyl-carrier protein] reductase